MTTPPETGRRKGLLDLGEFLLDTGDRDSPGHSLTVTEENRRRAGDIQTPTVIAVTSDRRGIAVIASGGSLAVNHPVVPGLGPIRCTPDLLRFAHRILGKDRVQENINRDVVQRLQLPGQTLAITAVGVLESSQNTTTIAADLLDRLIQRQVVETDGRQLAQPA